MNSIQKRPKNDSETQSTTADNSSAERSAIVRKRRAALLLFVFIAAVAVYLRVVEIDVRPPHSDEGVNYLFVETTNREGYYPYSHENYHGPLYFYLSTWIVNTFGDSLLALRASSILSGVLTVILLAAFVPLEGWVFPLVAALFIALSPSGIFLSRYAIHEPLFVLETLAFAVCCFYWCRRQRPIYLYFGAVSVAALVATKETFPIAVLSIILGTVAVLGPRSFLRAARLQLQHFGAAYLLGLVCTLCAFTGGFRWPGGVREMLMALPQWFSRSHSDIGHFKPALYYLNDVIAVAEPQLLAQFAAALVLPVLRKFIGFVRDEDTVGFFGRHAPLATLLTVWSLFTLITYSAISYKTAWLIINLTIPMTLLAALALTALIESKTAPVRTAGLIFTAVFALSAWNNTLKYNYSYSPVFGPTVALAESFPYGAHNPFSYVHTSPGMVELVRKVEEYWKRKPDAKVLIGVEGYFPLPYYFRHRSSQCAYSIPPNIDEAAKNYDIMILDFYKHKWSSPEWDQQYYRLSDYAESYTYFRRPTVVSESGRPIGLAGPQ